MHFLRNFVGYLYPPVFYRYELEFSSPELCVIHGSPQCQGSIGRANQRVQRQENNLLRKIKGRRPFKGVFGSDPKYRLESLFKGIYTIYLDYISKARLRL